MAAKKQTATKTKEPESKATDSKLKSAMIKIVGLGGITSPDTIISDDNRIKPGVMVDTNTLLAYVNQFLDDGYQLSTVVTQGTEGNGGQTRVLLNLVFTAHSGLLPKHNRFAVVGDFNMDTAEKVAAQEQRLANLLEDGFIIGGSWPMGHSVHGTNLFHWLVRPPIE